MNWHARHMTPAEYRFSIELLGMNRAQAGRFLGVSLATAYRYASGDVPVPVPTALLLRHMIHHSAKPWVPPHIGIRARRAAEKLGIAP